MRNALPVRYPEGLQARLLDHFQNEGWSHGKLLGAHHDLTHRFAQPARVPRAVKLAVEIEQRTHVPQIQRRFWVV